MESGKSRLQKNASSPFHLHCRRPSKAMLTTRTMGTRQGLRIRKR
jgi:hypothetical protein